MEKLPPIEKVYEAYTAIADRRVAFRGDAASVKSSDGARQYTVAWEGNRYSSDDNATFWQGYAGYPVLAVLMLQGKLPLDRTALPFLSGINWNALNRKNRRNYAAAFAEATAGCTDGERRRLRDSAAEVLAALRELDIVVGRAKKKRPGQK